MAYEFSFAQTGKSGYSFGVAQVDLGAGRNPGANAFLKSIGLSDAEIATLRSGGSGNVLSPVFLTSVNAKLQSNQERIDAYSAGLLDSKIRRLETIVDKVQQSRPDVAQSILDSDAVKLAILDYDNQLVVTGAGSATERDGLLLKFLKGESVLNPLGAKNAPSQLAESEGITPEDILKLKFEQTEWGKKFEGKRDINNRNDKFQKALDALKVSEGIVDDVDNYGDQFDPNQRVYVAGSQIEVDGRTYQVQNDDTLVANLPGGYMEIRSSGGVGLIVDGLGRPITILTGGDRVLLGDDGELIVMRTFANEAAPTVINRNLEDLSGRFLQSTATQYFDDGSTNSIIAYPNGRSETVAANPDGSIASRITTTPTGNNTEQIDSYSYDSVGRGGV